MYAGAGTFSGLRYRGPVDRYWLRPLVAGNGSNRAAPAPPKLSEQRLDDLVGPTPIPAPWLPALEQRIRESIAPSDADYVNDGQWLRPNIAGEAMRFFQGTSDVLPGEPYIYTLLNGDLVAEFRAAHGNVTSIVQTTSVITFAVIDGQLLDRKLELRNDNLAAARQELQRLTNELRTGEHGALEPTQ